MKQELLTDIELDVHELKYLMDSFSKEPTQTLSELLKRSVQRMQERLEQLSEEIDTVQIIPSPSIVEEEIVEKEDEFSVIEESKNPVEEFAESSVVEAVEEEIMETEEQAPVIKKEETHLKQEYKSPVLGECIKLSAGLRHSISLNDSFRFSRELFGGDSDLMNRVIEQISVMSSYKTAVAFFSSKVNINEENEAVNDFLELLKKYFNQPA